MRLTKLLLLLSAFAFVACGEQGNEELIAIDVLIQPGPKMMEEAEVWNARMREQAPDGFALDEEHAPHVTLLQCFVARSDLPRVLAVVDELRSTYKLETLEMTATGLYYIPTGDRGLAGIVIEPSDRLLALQAVVIASLDNYMRKGGGEAAFVPDKSGAAFDAALFEYVDTFVPTQSGASFNPHVTIGLAPRVWLDEEKGKPFQRFTFGAEGLAVYQLGNFGTASKRLDPGD